MQSDQQQVGLITDIHYDGSGKAMNRLYSAVATLNRGGVDALVVMGDLVNGTSAFHADRLLREVSALCGAFRGPVYFMPGNHDLDHLSKPDFYSALGRSGETACFDFVLGGHRLISIDGNYSPDGTAYAAGNFRWEEAFVPDEQLAALETQLAAADEPVILLSHQRVDLPSTFSVRNDISVRQIIHASGKVKAVLQGHQHADDLQKPDGTAYYTLSAHVDDAGPAVLMVGASEVRLIRDYQPA